MRAGSPLLLLAVLSGCGGDEGPALTATPADSSLFGHQEVTLSGDVASLGEIVEVTVGGVRAYDLRPAPGAITITLQGSLDPGPADLVVIGRGARSVRRRLFTYRSPASGVPLRWVAFGASLTQGAQSGGIDPHGQVHGVSGQVARAASVYLGLPLLTRAVLPPLRPQDLGPDCTAKPNTGASYATLTAAITDQATGLFDLRRARIDPTLTSRNLAIGGSKLDEILHGAANSGGAIIEHIVEAPDTPPAEILSRIDRSQIDRLEALDPDIAFSADLLGNDVDPAVVAPDDLYPSRITPLATVKPQIEEVAARLGRLHGHYFIANLPSLSFLPNVAALRAIRLAAGTDTTATFDAKLAAIEALADSYNGALAAALALHPNLHLVDLHAEVESLRGGVTVAGQPLTTRRFGGLLSLDHLHFTDTGYALLADLFIRAINDTLGLKIPAPDLAAVHATDELSPSALRAAGLTCPP
ncbi:MAG: hypothetical protein EXR72_16880 [Myxococcales bacterium]|nr:hypothetical protein [Myxococcales bacterium]